MPVTPALERPPAPASYEVRDLRVEVHPGVPTVIAISGDIDIASASWLGEVLLVVIQPHRPTIWVDLQGVTFLDCSGVNALLAAARRARLHGGRMWVIRPSVHAWRIITVLRLQDVLIRDDERQQEET